MTALPFTPLADERFGQLVRRRRRELNMTQLQLATIIGTGRFAVGEWERGNTLPVTPAGAVIKRGTISAAARALDTPYPILYEATEKSLVDNWHPGYIKKRPRPVKIRSRLLKAACGTEAGYMRHYRMGEYICGDCRMARRDAAAKRRREKGIVMRRKALCGTISGVGRHYRMSEPVCDECQVARREYRRRH